VAPKMPREMSVPLAVEPSFVLILRDIDQLWWIQTWISSIGSHHPAQASTSTQYATSTRLGIVGERGRLSSERPECL